MSKVTIGKILDDGAPLRLDIPRLIETRLILEASSGGGKSTAIRKVIEEVYGSVQIIILDIEGEFSTLRDQFDFIVAGKGGDIHADPRSAELLARKALELKIDLIVDLYELPPHDRIRYVRRFMEAMINAPKDLWHPVLVWLDEGHIFAPEKSKSESLSAVIDMASRGRKRGYCLGISTQRPAKLHKDVAAECQNKLIGLANLDIDRKRAAEELGFTDRSEIMTLRDLEPGQFYAVGPAFGKGVKGVKIGQPKTTQPKAGAARARAHAPAPTSRVKQALAKLADLPKQAEEEARDVATLRQRIRELEREVREAKASVKVEKKTEKVLDEKALARATNQVRVEMLRIMKAELAGFSKITLDRLSEYEVVLQKSAVAPRETADLPAHKAITARPAPTRILRDLSSSGTGEKRLSKPAREMLNLLIVKQGEALNRAQLGGWTGYSLKSSSFKNALGELRSTGLITGSSEEIVLPPATVNRAIEAIGPDYNPDVSVTLDGWASKLSAAARAIFNVLREEPIRAYSKDELSERTGYSVTSSSFKNALGELCSKKLAERVAGDVQLNPSLIN